ncbi:hypothetical protein C8R47DRAFT_62165 [Mycena vitilis]|nr:hypothetical protein C8R47DRAFT_62165 [Mycena vitilis]
MKEHLILAKTLNLRETGEALRAHAKNYAAAKAKFDNFAWLLQFERTASQSLARAAGNKVKTQSLIRFTDKLERPYNNYVVINTAARRSKLKDISVPLEVLIHLPTARSLPSPPSVVSKTRVLAYLQSALQSPALAAQPEAEETIQASWNLIFEALGKEKEQQGKQNRSEPSCHLPPPSAPHCECTLLRYHLNKLNNHLDAQGPSARTPYPYIGVSKLSCFQCALYFEAYNACQLGPPFQTRSSYTKVVP